IIFTGIYRAKGNEAAMIYFINAHECFSGSELARKRNILFTAMTRSKAWLRVLGYGEEMKGLVAEFEEVKSRNFVLEFTYPTEQERKQMKVINRDKSPQERESITKQTRTLKELVTSLEKGLVRKEDLPEEELEKLKNYLLK
ncbi:MAG: ATP-binding domain-containing protein, partial [Dolichospermum sp.]